MDEINAFFDLSKPFKRNVVMAGATNGRMIYDDNFTNKIVGRPEHGTQYSQSFVEEANRNLQEAFSNPTNDELSLSDDEFDEVDPVYQKYRFNNQRTNLDLPVFQNKEGILKAIKDNRFVVIQGGTGCGKSTQIPQFILNYYFEKKVRCNIVVTQPRRIAARSIAERVCDERGWSLGSVVGYQIGLDSENCSEDTRILYCTTGLLLEKLTKTKSLSTFTHIILDEVHERDKDMDFLFIVIRKLMSQNPGKVKVILMSATIDAPKFAEYFQMPKSGDLVSAPIVKIDKKSQFDVRQFYLDDCRKLNPTISINFDEPGISEEVYKLALNIIKIVPKFDKPNMGQTVEGGELPAILVFLPGIQEIVTFQKILMANQERDSTTKWQIFVLHSMISATEQRMIFRQLPQNVRKIILSTNIAESSITVPNVRYVIDFCLTKHLITDTATNLTALRLCWASRNNCRQRSGRAGRVMDGRCYRLIPKNFFDILMDESAIPELVRSPLENVVLKTKLLEMGPPYAILALAMDVPKLTDIANTVLVLKELGALLITSDGVFSEHDGDITFLGRVMANLPVDVRIARLIVLGYCLGIFEDCVIIGAGLNGKNIFANSFREPLKAYSRKLEWSNGSGSDLFALLNVFKVWTVKHNQREFGDSPEQKQEEKRFGENHFVAIRALYDCNLLINELKKRLMHLGIRETSGRPVWSENERALILKVVIAGAFYPNFFLRCSSGLNNERDTYHCLNSRDPCNTVYFSEFNQRYIRQLYVSSIKDLLIGSVVDKGNAANVKVAFGASSERVFVSFQPPKAGLGGKDWDTHHATIPGKILTEVYKAVKMRKLAVRNSINVIGEPNRALNYAQEIGICTFENGAYTYEAKRKPQNISQSCLPRLSEKTVVGTVTSVESCDHFWFRPDREKTVLKKFFDELNPIEDSDIVEPILDQNDIQIGEVLTARNPSDGFFYRAKVINMDKINEKLIFTLRFIDIGTTIDCGVNDLLKFRNECNTEQVNFPPRCFPCCLACVQPYVIYATKNEWDKNAYNLLAGTVCNRLPNKWIKPSIEVYSVVDEKAHVYLHVGEEIINNTLVEKGYGEFCEENYLSKANHAQRKSRQARSGVSDENDYDSFYPVEEIEAIPPLPRELCLMPIKLGGPFSPLEIISGVIIL